MRDAARYDPRRSALSTYLYGVARHQTRRRLLRERRFVALDAGASHVHNLAATGDAADDLMQRSEMIRLRRAILSLPSRYREIVVLCDVQDVSYADAAVTLECPLGTVRSRLHRARQLLAEKMRRTDAHEQALRATMRAGDAHETTTSDPLLDETLRALKHTEAQVGRRRTSKPRL
jgi:RNA polymerase sigma-70 factor (ECF subfamily)